MIKLKTQRSVFFIAIIFFSLLTGNSFAQTTDGYEKPASNRMLWKNNFYMIFGYTAPIGKWSKTPDVNHTVTDAYLQNTGMGATRGISFEIGSFFHFKRMKPILHDRFKLGLNVSYLDGSVVFMNSGWEKIGGAFTSSQTSYNPFYFFGVKVGMIGTFSIAKHMFVDVYANVYPTASVEGTVNVPNSNGGGVHGYGNGVGYGTRGTVGINYRVLVFNFGVEMIFGNIMYNSSVDYNTSTSLSTDNFRTSFNTNTIKAKIGFVF